VFQLRGLPFPPIHSLRISKSICSASSQCFLTIAFTSVPVSSFKSELQRESSLCLFVQEYFHSCLGDLEVSGLSSAIKSINQCEILGALAVVLIGILTHFIEREVIASA